MKNNIHFSAIKSYIIAGIFLVLFFALVVIFIIKTINLSFWFVFLVMFFLLCLTINYQIFKSIFNIGIKIDNGYVHLKGLGVDDKNKFHIGEIKSIELQDFKKNPIASQETYEYVNLCFLLKSGRVKRLQVNKITDSKFIEIKEYFETEILNKTYLKNRLGDR